MRGKLIDLIDHNSGDRASGKWSKKVTKLHCYFQSRSMVLYSQSRIYSCGTIMSKVATSRWKRMRRVSVATPADFQSDQNLSLHDPHDCFGISFWCSRKR